MDQLTVSALAWLKEPKPVCVLATFKTFPLVRGPRNFLFHLLLYDFLLISFRRTNRELSQLARKVNRSRCSHIPQPWLHSLQRSYRLHFHAEAPNSSFCTLNTRSNIYSRFKSSAEWTKKKGFIYKNMRDVFFPVSLIKKSFSTATLGVHYKQYIFLGSLMRALN